MADNPVYHPVSGLPMYRPSSGLPVYTCGAACNSCSDTIGTTYQVDVPAGTFADNPGETCAASFNGASFEVTVGHPFYAGLCCRALDITGIVCDTGNAEAVVLCFEGSAIIVQFIFGSGNFIQFSFVISSTYSCQTGRTLSWDNNTGSPPITSSAGKQVHITLVS